jgi:hypothetical protein
MTCGLVARTNKVTMPEGLPVATRRAGPFWPIAALLVGRYTLAWLPPCSLRLVKIGSVKAVQTSVIPLLQPIYGDDGQKVSVLRKFDHQFFIPMHKTGGQAFWFLQHIYPQPPLCHFLQQHHQLHFGNTRPDAAVDTVAE